MTALSGLGGQEPPTESLASAPLHVWTREYMTSGLVGPLEALTSLQPESYQSGSGTPEVFPTGARKGGHPRKPSASSTQRLLGSYQTGVRSKRPEGMQVNAHTVQSLIFTVSGGEEAWPSPPLPPQYGGGQSAMLSTPGGPVNKEGCVVRREGLGRVLVSGSRTAQLGEAHGQPMGGKGGRGGEDRLKSWH